MMISLLVNQLLELIELQERENAVGAWSNELTEITNHFVSSPGCTATIDGLRRGLTQLRCSS